jgi:hypothetical protein
MVTNLANILGGPQPPTLLLGNGVNRHRNNDENSSWERLLQILADRHGLQLTQDQLKEMSNTELFDILDLARPFDDRSSLQRDFCDLMKSWQHKDHHRTLMEWAARRSAPVITVNFDEMLSQGIGAAFIRTKSGFTDFYPWSSYFSTASIGDARSSFAIWHAHGMSKYPRSIRLGLTHYMGSVERARRLIYGTGGLRSKAVTKPEDWKGAGTWLEPFFFCPIVVIGFAFGKDENFLRWLFLERARLHRIKPDMKTEAWFVVKGTAEDDHRRAFLERLGIKMIFTESYEEIYDNPAWKR